ncbi:MAG: 2-C-methyl-D-erythritol 4-phosphate cytidylyltransferase, partial [Oscillospiraceae bacterium]|nr:2-C-methyl-D-erythritol 4-phosphate cytidylyltransferase [Oscillospiraceae bacterium]
FDAQLLRAALQSAVENHAPITDDCSAVERLGKQVYLTEGSQDNFKITTPLDMILAQAIMERRGE